MAEQRFLLPTWYKMQEITFAHFFIETQDTIEPYIYKTINPYNMKFLKSKDIYLAVGVLETGTMEVYSTVGKGIDGFRELIKNCKRNDISILKFGCSENNITTQAIYKYAGAEKVEEIKNFYSNGDTCFRYVLKINESKRLN